MSRTVSVDERLESALEQAEHDRVRYHLREALQLRVAESVRESDAELEPVEPA
ncbi:hypothetical protein ACFQGE_17880 [Halomicroarcula sp. GCM10025817]|uniref:hypothetical protein n=1 Tax=Haloarcula TaxID=2237 RepID=UPI0023E865B3|nr:hypothetical protein [Halomicroarcula sp. SYNS111]